MLESERALILTVYFSVPRLNPCLRVIIFSLSLSRLYTQNVRPFVPLARTFLPVYERGRESVRGSERKREMQDGLCRSQVKRTREFSQEQRGDQWRNHGTSIDVDIDILTLLSHYYLPPRI